MDSTEVGQTKTLIIVEINEYTPQSAVIKTIIKKTTGNISGVSCDTGESLTEQRIPYNTFLQIIDGKAADVIDETSNLLELASQLLYRVIRPIL